MGLELEAVLLDLLGQDRTKRLAMLHRLREEGSAALFTELLEGASWDEWSFSGSRHLPESPKALICTLLCFAPPDCERAESLAATVRSVTLEGTESARLQLSGCPGLQRFSEARYLNLDHFVLDDLRVLTLLPNLGQISLQDGRIPDGLPGLVLGAKVGTLTLAGCGLTALGGLEAAGVSYLTLSRNPLTSLESLPELPALRHLRLQYCSELRSLQGIERYPLLREVDLWQCSSLEDLRGLRDREGLTFTSSLSMRFPSLRSLQDVPSAPALTKLLLEDLHALESLDGLERLTGLEHLGLQGIRKPVSVAPLAALSKLQVLDLCSSPGVTSLAPLDDHEELKVVLLHGSGVARRDVRQELRWRCSWAGRPDVRKLLKEHVPSDGKPRARTASVRSSMDGEGKSSLASVRKMLKSEEFDTVEQGLELLRALEDTSLYEALLEGVDYRRVARRGWRLGSSKFSGPLEDYLLHRLLAEAPAGSERLQALRDQITELDFVNLHYGRVPAPLDLHSLSVLPLKRLKLHYYGPLSGGEEARLPVLTELELWGCHGEASLRWLARSPQLAKVKLSGGMSWLDELGWVVGLEHLGRLELGGGNPDLAPLASSSVQELILSECKSLSSVEALAEMPRVRRIWLKRGPVLPEALLATLKARDVAVMGR